jgi:blue copper oxidase
MTPSRRDILRAGTLGVASLAGCRVRASALALVARKEAGKPAAPDLELTLRAAPGIASFDDGSGAHEVWRFDGKLLSGPPQALVPFAGGYLGPTIRARSGQRLRVKFDNALAEPSIVHFHGLDVSAANDGHPRLAVGPGGSYGYDFTLEQRPGTYWYHPHPDGRTGPQAYMGLAGLFIVDDPDASAMGLPTGEQELPLVLQDRAVDGRGDLVYAPNPMIGLLGDRVFINGRAAAPITVNAGCYRLRLLNGSNARIFKLAWSHGAPVMVLGSDGGLLAAPVAKPYVMLAPGERVEVWADFGKTPDEVRLESLAFEGGQAGMRGMGAGMMDGRDRSGMSAAVPNGAPMPVCRFLVKGSGPRLPLPKRLSPPAWRPEEEVANLGRPRRFSAAMGMMRWTLNGHTFAMDDVASNERVKLGTTEDWEFTNVPHMMPLPHPIHLHGAQFQIVERRVSAGWESAAATVSAGLVDEGWKDTFLLMPGESVRLRVRFARHAGLFLYHCHNLEHEDMGMMRNFLVSA